MEVSAIMTNLNPNNQVPQKMPGKLSSWNHMITPANPAQKIQKIPPRSTHASIIVNSHLLNRPQIVQYCKS